MPKFKHFNFNDDYEYPCFTQLERNTSFPGRDTEPGNFMIAVPNMPDSIGKGICINGDYGINPSAEEMLELVEVLRICVAAHDRIVGRNTQ
jgi:hypothetical protein